MNWNYFFKQYDKKAYVIAYNYLNNKEDALDVVQEAMLSMYKNYSELTVEAEARSLFFKILNNKMVDKYRSLKRIWDRFKDSNEESIILGNEENHTECILITKSFKELSSIQKRVFLLKTVQEFTFKEIAEVLNVTESTCKTHYSRSLKKIKEHVNQN